MTIHLHEAYRAGQVILQLIGAGTLVKFASWLYRRTQGKLEDKVIDTFKRDEGHWLPQTAHGVVSHMKREAVHKYACALFPPRIVDWASFISWLGLIPLRLRYLYHRKLVIPTVRKADRTLRSLWKRGLLICPPDNPRVYQLKH